MDFNSFLEFKVSNFLCFLAPDKYGGKEIQSRKSQTGIAKDIFLKTHFMIFQNTQKK
jgi:hypothetical protein